MSADRPARCVRLVLLRKEAGQSLMFSAGRAPALHDPVATRPGGCGNKVLLPDAAGRHRWQCPDKNAAHGAEHLQVLHELHRNGAVGMVRGRAESQHVQELVAQGHVALRPLPIHHNTEFEARLTDKGKQYLQQRQQQNEQRNEQQQARLFKARSPGTEGETSSAGGGGSPAEPRRGEEGTSGPPSSPRYARVHDGYGGQALRPVRVHTPSASLRKCDAEPVDVTGLRLRSPLPGASLETVAGSGLRQWTVGPYTATLTQGRGVYAITLEGGELPLPFHLVCPAPDLAERIAADAAEILAKGGLPPRDGLFRRRGRLLV